MPRRPPAPASRARTRALAILGVALIGYLGVCGFLFIEQRHLIYQPPVTRLDMPPVGSGYRLLKVEVPDLGVLSDWWAPAASSALPTVVFFHGNAADRRTFLQLADLLRQHGWGVVLASYRGYSGNPGQPTEAGLMADARATLAAVAPRAGPVIVWGHSLGSGVAARMASEGRAAGLVLESPYTSVVDLAARSDPYVPVRWLLLDRYDTEALLRRIHVPVLIFHSVDDRVIPFAMGRELADRLGPQATFVKLEGAGHYPHRRDLSAQVLLWAHDLHLGNQPDPASPCCGAMR